MSMYRSHESEADLNPCPSRWWGSVQLRNERGHARWEGLCGARGQVGPLDQERRDDQLLAQRQLAADLVAQLDGVPSQPPEIRLVGMVVLPQGVMNVGAAAIVSAPA